MSISDQAQQLAALASQVSTEQLLAVRESLGEIRRQVDAALGQTASATEIHNLIQQIQSQIESTAQGMEQLKILISNTSGYHQRG